MRNRKETALAVMLRTPASWIALLLSGVVLLSLMAGSSGVSQ